MSQPDTFALVVGARPGVPLKPDPAAALLVAEGLGVAPARIAYVGDSGVDMRTARGAAMIAIRGLVGFSHQRGVDRLSAPSPCSTTPATCSPSALRRDDVTPACATATRWIATPGAVRRPPAGFRTPWPVVGYAANGTRGNKARAKVARELADTMCPSERRRGKASRSAESLRPKERDPTSPWSARSRFARSRTDDRVPMVTCRVTQRGDRARGRARAGAATQRLRPRSPPTTRRRDHG